MKIRKNFPPAFCCLLITAFLFVLSGCFTGKVGTTAPAELSELQQELTNKTWLLSGMFFENQFIPLEPGHGSNHILLFYEDGTFESSTGINVLEGTWTLKKPAGNGRAGISFEITSESHETYGDEDAAKFENTFIGLFDSVRKIDSYGNQFSLYDGEGKTILKFILNNPDW